MKQNGEIIHLYLQISVSSLRCFTEIKIQPAVGSFSSCIIWNVHTTKILLSLRYNFTKIQLHCTRGSLRLCIIQNCRVIKWKSVLSIFMFHKALRNNSHKLRYILLLFYYILLEKLKYTPQTRFTSPLSIPETRSLQNENDHRVPTLSATKP